MFLTDVKAYLAPDRFGINRGSGLRVCVDFFQVSQCVSHFKSHF